MKQTVLTATEHYSEIDAFLAEKNIKTLLLVCADHIKGMRIGGYFKELPARKGVKVVYFTDFEPNPLYESVVKGVTLFLKERCDAIFAVGGGSAMDVAKCIKLYANMDHSENYLSQPIVPNSIPLFAVPTTAGTGSEATRYSVIYFEGAKQSVADESCIPETVLMDADTLSTLPAYQRKVTMLDALCHAIESFWSVNSNTESEGYSRAAIEGILEHMEGYLASTPDGNEGMLKAANLAGKAINITQTTAGHAMCYKLTSLYGIAHGHAAALCLKALLFFTAENTDKCIDPRGEKQLQRALQNISVAMGCAAILAAAEKFKNIVNALGLNAPECKADDLDILCGSVNPVRLKNYPVALDETDIRTLYTSILKGE